MTIAGSGFGPSQGSGTVLLGSLNGEVVSWSDTEIVATVASGSVSGVVRVQQNGTWSNARTFTVPGGTNTLAPNVVSMAVGETRTLQALATMDVAEPSQAGADEQWWNFRGDRGV